MRRFLLLLLLVPMLAPAQNRSRILIDSLLTYLPDARNDTNKARILLLLSENYTNFNADTAISYANHAILLADSLNWLPGIGYGNYHKGFNYYNNSDYVRALQALFTGLAAFEHAKDEIGIANTERKIGNIYRDQRNYPKAIEYYNKALQLFEKNRDRLGMGRVYSNLGEIYTFQGKYEAAEHFLEKALAIYTEAGYTNGLTTVYGRLASVYTGHRKYSTALNYNLKALQIVNNPENVVAMEQIQETYGELGKSYLDVAKGRNDISGKNQYLDSAINYLSKAITLAHEMRHKTDLRMYSRHLAEAEQLRGNYKKGLQDLFYSYRLYDTLFSAQKNATLFSIETEREKILAQRVEALEKEKARNNTAVVVAAFLLLLFILLIVYRNYRKQQLSATLLDVEKKKSEALLHNILPDEVASELKEKGVTTAKHFDNVTVMFTDFVNFTMAGERMGTQKLVEELHTCFKAFDEIIGRYDIEKIKTIGDAYLAVSGLPLPGCRHAEQLVRAATEIREFMLNRRQQLGEHTFEIRIGIHSGPVVAGIVGVKKFAYDIWGDTVNTAARIEQRSEAGKINISHTTYDLVKEKFICTYRGEIEAKNKGKLTMYFVDDPVPLMTENISEVSGVST